MYRGKKKPTLRPEIIQPGKEHCLVFLMLILIHKKVNVPLPGIPPHTWQAYNPWTHKADEWRLGAHGHLEMHRYLFTSVIFWDISYPSFHFLPLYPLIYLSSLSFKFSFQWLLLHVYVHTYVSPKFNLFTLYVMSMHVFRDGHLVLSNQLAYSSLGEDCVSHSQCYSVA